ncbi:MAG: type II secretion system protein N [Cognaticolwellia sp.]|jgi:type II secretion system protein N
MQRLILAVGAVLVALISFGLGLKLTFPSELAAARAAYEIDQGSDGALAIELSGLSPWRISGAHVDTVDLYSIPKPKRRSDEPGPPARVLSMQDVQSRVSVLPLLGGVYKVSLDGELYKGTIEGVVVQDGSQTLIDDLLIDEADLSMYPMDFGELSVNAQGLLRTRVTNFDYDTENLDKVRGKIRLEIDSMVLDGLKVSGIALPTSTFTEAVLSFTLDDGQAKVKKGSFKANTLELEIEGRIELAKSFSRSKLDLELKLRLLDESLDGLAKMALGSSRDPDGVYHFEVGGTVGNPNAKPMRLGGSSRSSRGSGPNDGPDPNKLRPGMGQPPPPFNASDRDPDARRKDREERIRQRREGLDAPARPSEEPDFDDEEDDYDDEEEDDYDEEDFEDEDFQDGLPNAARMPSVPNPGIVPVQFGEDVDYPDPLPFDED